MAFNYEILKKLSGAAFEEGAIHTADLLDSGLGSTNIATGAVTASKLGANAVNLNSATTTGTMPVSKGGTGTTAISGAGNAVVVSGSSLGSNPHGLYGMQVFTSNGTWNRPTGVRYIKVQVQGGGGGGSGHGESGGAGGYSERIIDVTGISSVSVTVSGEAGGTYYFGRGGNGGSSSFGNYASASGGRGANRNNSHCGGLSGVGSGGNLNIYTGGGRNHHQESGFGAKSFWGGSVAGGHPNGGNFSHNHQSHSAQGSGGAGGYFNGHRGSNGRPGMVVVTMYY